jgi:hypothetical protein
MAKAVGPPTRREILGGLSIAAFTASSTVVESADASGAQSDGDTPEYRESEYVRRFYELARR